VIVVVVDRDVVLVVVVALVQLVVVFIGIMSMVSPGGSAGTLRFDG
jgi:hypothetical protein